MNLGGIGKITAAIIIVTTNEFKDIKDPKKFACHAGVAPFVKESGLFKGTAQGRIRYRIFRNISLGRGRELSSR